MKKILFVLLFASFNSYSFDFKKFFKEDLKYNASFSFGKVDIEIENKFDSDFEFTFVSFGGGASFKLTSNYTVFASILFRKFTNLDYNHDGATGSKSISTVYSDLYFGAQRQFKEFLLTAGYDNLNYFVGDSSTVVEPIRIDRVVCLLNIWDKFRIFKLTIRYLA